MPRTAHVVAEEETTLLQVPAPVLREMTSKPVLNRLFLSKMTERMVRMKMLDIPRMLDRDQGLLRELRTPEPEPVVAA
jgi:CRP-like cAMP-binding protein